MTIPEETVHSIQGAYRAGDLDRAASLCSGVLEGDPLEPWALHLMGLIRARRGDHAGAADLMGRAIAARPNSALFHLNLGEAYRNLGDWRRATGSCRMALMLCPDYPEAFNTLGLIDYGQGLYAEALEGFRRALAIRPGMANAESNLGLVLQKLGRLDEAIVHLAHAVGSEPGIARYRTQLGFALIDLGRLEEALAHFREAARLQPDSAAAHHDVGHALRLLGRGIEARAAFMEALRLDVGHSASYLNIGITLRSEGQLEEAVIWHRKALESSPEDVHAWQQTAELHSDREDYRAAIPCWEKALALSAGDKAATHLNLGWALQEDGRLDEARGHYLAALELYPDWALAWHYIGGIHEEVGELAEAEAAYRESIRLHPARAQTHARLGLLLREEMSESDLAPLRDLAADPGVDRSAVPSLLFALAQNHDGRGQYLQAAEVLREANALALEASKGRREYRPADHERFIGGIVRHFDADFFRGIAGSGSTSRRPVFVFGLPRSGTTLVEQILASHPGIHGAGELKVLRDVFESIPTALGRRDSPVDCVADLDPATVRGLAEEHLARLRELDGGKSERIVDKMPDNYMYLGFLAALFPEATLIHCRRDLRDVAVSCWMTDFRYIRWTNDFGHIASRFRQYRRLMDHWEAVLPVPVHRVDYEETVTDLEGVARRLLGACGLDWDPACLEFHRTRKAVRTASLTQVRRPIYTKSMARWKNYATPLADLFRALPTGTDGPSPEAGPGLDPAAEAGPGG